MRALPPGTQPPFRLATSHPELVASVLAIPGFALTDEDRRGLAGLAEADVPVVMFVGSQDSTWVEPAGQTADVLRKAGGKVDLTVVPDQPHVITSVTGFQLFALLEAL